MNLSERWKFLRADQCCKLIDGRLPDPPWIAEFERARTVSGVRALRENGSARPSLRTSSSVYVGDYQLTPTFVIRITREGGRLFLQATGQPRFELFASAEREFFLKAIDAQITFNVDDVGRDTGLVLHQAGAHQPAKRTE